MLLMMCGQLFNCTDKCPDDMPHKATDMTSEELETVCIAEPLVYESVTTLYLYHHHHHPHPALTAVDWAILLHIN